MSDDRMIRESGMTFEDYVKEHLERANLSHKALELVRMGWNAKGEFGEVPASGEPVGIMRHINDPMSDDPDALVEWLFGGDEINLPHGTKLYTHPPAKVPEGYAKEKLTEALRQFRHNNDNTGSIDRPEQGFVFGYDKAVVDELIALLTTPATATTAGAESDEWIFNRPPTFPEGDWHSEVWALARDGAIELLGVNEVIVDWKADDGKGLIAWMKTGLKEPKPPVNKAPPQEQSDE